MFALKNFVLAAIAATTLGTLATTAHADVYYAGGYTTTYVAPAPTYRPVYVPQYQPQYIVVQQPVYQQPIYRPAPICPPPPPPVIYHPYDRDDRRYFDRDDRRFIDRDDARLRIGYHW